MSNIENPKKRLSFGSYYGLEEVVVLSTEFEEALADRIERNTNNHFNKILPNGKIQGYPCIKIADTFFSDTFPESNLESLYSVRKDFNLKFKYLLLNPFSQLARMRANVLDDAKSIRVNIRQNTGLRKIISAISGKRNIEINDEFETNKASIRYLAYQLEKILELSQGHTEIKFTDDYTDLPFYIVGPYVFKGNIFPFKSALHNPWSIYVDDPIQSNDMFGTLDNAFNILWSRAKKSEDIINKIVKVQDKYRTIFVSHGHDHEAMLEVKDVIENTKLNGQDKFHAHYFQQEFKEGDSTLVPRIWQESINNSTAAIVLLLKEDSINETFRARQNVIHELGYLQAKFGSRRVLIVIEEGVDFPSNIQGEMFYYISRNNSRHIQSDSLTLRIRNFLDNI